MRYRSDLWRTAVRPLAHVGRPTAAAPSDPFAPSLCLPRSSYSGGPCPSYIVGSPGCAAFAPTLANVPSGYTQLLFDSAGGNANRYYIRQAVSDAAGGWGEAASSEPGSRRPCQRNQHLHASRIEGGARRINLHPCAACMLFLAAVAGDGRLRHELHRHGQGQLRRADDAAVHLHQQHGVDSLVDSAGELEPCADGNAASALCPLPLPPSTLPSHPSFPNPSTHLQVAPDPPVIDATSLKGATLNVMLGPPAYAGFSGAWLPAWCMVNVRLPAAAHAAALACIVLFHSRKCPASPPYTGLQLSRATRAQPTPWAAAAAASST